MQKCQHEVPCICDEYLNGLTQEQLMNLRIEFGTVITNAQQALATGSVLLAFVDSGPKPNVKLFLYAMRRMAKREAAKSAKKINQVLEEKFGYIIL